MSLIGEGPVPLRLEMGELIRHLLDDHIHPADALRHHIQLLHGLLLLLIKFGDAGDLVYDLAAVHGCHLYDASDIALHHNIVALRGDSRLGQKLMQLGLAAGFAVKKIGRGILVSLDLDPPGDLYGVGVQGKAATGVIQPDFDLSKIWIFGALASIDQVGKPLGAHGPGAGEAQGEEQGIHDIGLAAAVGTGDGEKIVLQGNPDAPAEGLEVLQLNLFDVQRPPPSPRPYRPCPCPSAPPLLLNPSLHCLDPYYISWSRCLKVYLYFHHYISVDHLFPIPEMEISPPGSFFPRIRSQAQNLFTLRQSCLSHGDTC